MTSRERVFRTIKFQTPDRMPYDFPPEYGTDFAATGMIPNPDPFLNKGVDEWGAVWDNIGESYMGQVVDYPLKDWKDFDKLNIPDMDMDRWKHVRGIKEKAGDKFIVASGISLFERPKLLRGAENAWTDPYCYPDELERLLDILVDMNLKAIAEYARYGVNGFGLADDLGLQNTLIMAPEIFRRFWKPRYAKLFKAVHDNGMLTFMHSCGYIVEILDDLIEVGLDVINMDQQENMGLELLGERFGGRITFFCPVDIQRTMVHGSLDDIRKYCRAMVKHFWRPEGGFIPRWYVDPKGAGHSSESLRAMCEEFLKIIQEL